MQYFLICKCGNTITFLNANHHHCRIKKFVSNQKAIINFYCHVSRPPQSKVDRNLLIHLYKKCIKAHPIYYKVFMLTLYTVNFLDHIVQNILSNILHQNNTLNDAQHAFRKLRTRRVLIAYYFNSLYYICDVYVGECNYKCWFCVLHMLHLQLRHAYNDEMMRLVSDH